MSSMSSLSAEASSEKSRMSDCSRAPMNIKQYQLSTNDSHAGELFGQNSLRARETWLRKDNNAFPDAEHKHLPAAAHLDGTSLGVAAGQSSCRTMLWFCAHSAPKHFEKCCCPMPRLPDKQHHEAIFAHKSSELGKKAKRASDPFGTATSSPRRVFNSGALVTKSATMRAPSPSAFS